MKAAVLDMAGGQTATLTLDNIQAEVSDSGLPALSCTTIAAALPPVPGPTPAPAPGGSDPAPAPAPDGSDPAPAPAPDPAPAPAPDPAPSPAPSPDDGSVGPSSGPSSGPSGRLLASHATSTASVAYALTAPIEVLNDIADTIQAAAGDPSRILAAVTVAVTAAAGLDAANLGEVDATSIVAPVAAVEMQAPTYAPNPESGTDDFAMKSGLSWIGIALVAGSIAV